MPWPTIDKARKWVGECRGLLMGLVAVAVEETITLVPGGNLSALVLSARAWS